MTNLQNALKNKINVQNRSENLALDLYTRHGVARKRNTKILTSK